MEVFLSIYRTFSTLKVYDSFFGSIYFSILRNLLSMSLFVAMILLFRLLNSTSVIDAIYVLCGYTYGPLLGLFTFGMLTKRMPKDRLVPYICIASPLLCYGIDVLTCHLTGYRLGYELLMLNGGLTFLALLASSRGIPSAECRSAS